MSTLGDLKARIKNDIFREDLDQQIAESIGDAIRYYQRKRFFFNERRDVTFQTVPGQIWYGEDVTSVALDLDNVFYVRTDSDVSQLRRTDTEDFAYLTDASASRGEPFIYAYYGRQIGVYPIPDKAYTIRLIGQFKLGAPANDTVSDNPWTNEAFELIRCRAKAYLYAHHIQDPQMAVVFNGLERDELASLIGETTRRVMYDGFRKTDF